MNRSKLREVSKVNDPVRIEVEARFPVKIKVAKNSGIASWDNVCEAVIPFPVCMP